MAWSTLTLVLIPTRQPLFFAQEATPVSYTHLDVYKRQKQDILAAYLGYQLKYTKLGGQAGIRYEHTFMDADYKNTVSYTHLSNVVASEV